MSGQDAGQEAEKPESGGHVLIVGCNGRMGKMLMESARGAGLAVRGTDMPFEDAGLAKCARGADMAIFCVPAKHLAQTLRRVAPWLPPGAIVADITSVKEIPMRQMEEIWPGAVVGTHPLFGPGCKKGDDMPVAVVAGKNAARADVEKVESFFEALGCRVFGSSAQTHDRAMARIQNLNFITNVAYFAALAGQEELLPFLTPSFERRRKAAAKMLTEDGEMFSGLVEANPYSQDAARQFRRMLELAASGDVRLLCGRARWWFGEDENRLPGQADAKNRTAGHCPGQ